MREAGINELIVPDWLPPDVAVRAYYEDSAICPNYKVQLTKYICCLLPLDRCCSVLDVGSGDGKLGALIARHRPTTQVIGIETFIRECSDLQVPTLQYDGRRFPFADKSFDTALVCDVLHHTSRKRELLAEVVRVTKTRIIIKDHLCESLVNWVQLYLLDLLGNTRHGVKVTGDYLSLRRWDALFSIPEVRRSSFHSGIPVRSGILGLLFSNQVEVIFVIDLVLTS